jgi:dTMP kinase
LFLTFEGIDGSGKSTQLKLLQSHLESLGRSVFVTREPGGTEVGEKIRKLLLHGEDLNPWTEVNLFVAARAELVATVVRPELDAGRDVILDRYIDSTLVYQGMARGLPEDRLLDWNLDSVEGLLPDRTFVLALPAEDATHRLGTQLRLFAVEEDGIGPPDRLERESYAFRRRVDDGYRALAQHFPGRIVEIDASKTKKQIARLVRQEIDSLLKSSIPSPPRLEMLSAACS